MHNNSFQQLINICNNGYENMDNASKPYRVRNMIVEIVETPKQNETISKDIPASATLPQASTGYLAVGVFTALGALPVKDAVVTVYTANEAGEENAIYHLVTDANGRIPVVELPVIYDPNNPLESSKYYFTTYNMRIQAINYYTVNVLDMRIFPNITTDYSVSLVPVMSGPASDHPEQIIVIPPSPIDKSND